MDTADYGLVDGSTLSLVSNVYGVTGILYRVALKSRVPIS